MPVLDRLGELLSRVGSYPAWEVAFEVGVIWLVLYAVVRFVQGTRAAGALKGMLLVLVVATLLVRVAGGGELFQRLTFLYDRLLALFAIALVVIFQPELRRALVRLGETPWFRQTPKVVSDVASEIAPACVYLSKARFGALIVIERQLGLRGLTEGGTVLNAQLTSRLLQTLFYPGSALHDLAVVVRGMNVHAAGVQLPMADASDMPDPELGSRHRAAVGLTKECDALVIVVSEETGLIRLADRGELSTPLDRDGLEAELVKRLGAAEVAIGDEGDDADAEADALSESSDDPGDVRGAARSKERA
ncbi:MAG: diadenylate cyclase CdaA [Planctomycetota bacterium]